VPVPEIGQRAVTKSGDLWQLGPHRILCGSSLDDASYQALMDITLGAAVFTDPPYNVKIAGHASGNGEIQHREFAMASGEMTPAEFQTFLNSFISLLIRYSTPQSVHYLCMDSIRRTPRLMVTSSTQGMSRLAELAGRNYVVMRNITSKWCCEEISAAQFRRDEKFSNRACHFSGSSGSHV
jgi:hypothetical protein